MMIKIMYIVFGITVFLIFLSVIGMCSIVFSKKEKDLNLVAGVIRDTMKFVFIIIALAFIFVFIYPTPYLYTNAGDRLIRVNRLTGDTYRLIPSKDVWQQVEGNYNKQ